MKNIRTTIDAQIAESFFSGDIATNIHCQVLQDEEKRKIWTKNNKKIRQIMRGERPATGWPKE